MLVYMFSYRRGVRVYTHAIVCESSTQPSASSVSALSHFGRQVKIWNGDLKFPRKTSGLLTLSNSLVLWLKWRLAIVIGTESLLPRYLWA